MEEIKGLMETLNATVNTNSAMLNASLKSLQDSIDLRLAAIETKMNNNFVTLTDANAKLKVHIDDSISRIDGEIMTVHNKEDVTEKKFQDLETEYNALTDRFTALERSNYSTQQHSRKYNLEIDGLPLDVTKENLRGAAVSLFNAINVRTTEDDIEVIHRLPANKTSGAKATIVRFHSREVVDDILEKKKHLNPISIGGGKSAPVPK